MESEVLTFMMDHVMVCPVNTIAHVPCSVRPLLAKVLSVELRKACSSVWPFVRLTMFAKAVLHISATSSMLPLCHVFCFTQPFTYLESVWGNL